MAIIRTHHYTASCAACGWWGPNRQLRGEAATDEFDHRRDEHGGPCGCPDRQGRVIHLTGCKLLLPTPTAAGAE